MFKGLPVDYLVEIGNRFLVAVSINNLNRVNATLEKVFQAGITFRETHGFNRFRLVVATTDKETQPSIQSVYDSLTIKDEKIHLHVVDPSLLPEDIVS